MEKGAGCMQNIVDVYKNATEQLQQVVSQTPQRIKQLHEIVQRSDWEEQDLLHLAELDTFSASEGYKLAKQIQKVRQRRRQAKDELEALNGIKAIMNNNSKFESHVAGIKKDMDTRAGRKKKYHVRVRTDLAKRFEKLNEE